MAIGTPALAAEADVAISAAQLRAQALPRPTLTIQLKKGNSPAQNSRAITIQRGDQLQLALPRQEGGEPRWFLVLPDLSQNYANAGRPNEPDAYHWHGLQAIPYWQVELVAERGRWEIEPLAGTSVAKAVQALGDVLVAGGAQREDLRFFYPTLGTFWFAATVETKGSVARTPGAADSDARGLLGSVVRVVVRETDDYLGVLAGFFNVPGVFGSTTYQASHHLGADCADVLMSALAEWTQVPSRKNANVQLLTATMPHVAELDIIDGVPSAQLRWGADVRPGDFIAVKYQGAGKYGHIGALYRDTDHDGLLGANDEILHNGPHALHESPLREGGFDGHVVILRPKAKGSK